MSLHTFELDVDSLLSEEDKIEIIKDEYRKVIRQVVNVDKERIFSNAAYTVVQKLVDEVFGEDLNTILVEKVKGIIKDLSSYTVFKKQDAWERDESKGWGLFASSYRVSGISYPLSCARDCRELLDHRSARRYDSPTGTRCCVPCYSGSFDWS